MLSGLALLLFSVYPLAVVLLKGLEGGAKPLLLELSEPATLRAWKNTVLLASMVCATATPIGAVLAWLIERTDLVSSERARARLSALLALPLAVPPYLLAMSWALLGNGRNGLLNRLTDSPWIDLYGLDGVVLVLSTSSYPFVFLAVRAALVRADPTLEEVARTAGAGPLQVLKTVTLPLSLPAIIAAAGLVFVFSTAAFGVPYLLGSVASPPVYFLTTRIYQYTTLGGEDMLQRAAAIAILLLATSLAAQAIASRIRGKKTVVQVSGKSARPAVLRLGALRLPARLGLSLFVAAVIALPLLTIAWTSLLATFADPMGLTTSHWSDVLSRKETSQAFLTSIGLAITAGAIVASLGLVIAKIAQTKATGRTGSVLSAMATAPYAVPGTVLAIGLLLAFAQEMRLIVLNRITFALYLPGTIGMLLVAYAIKYLAFGVNGARAALEQIHPSLEEAARTSGAGPLKSAIDVVLPLVSPAVFAAFLVVALPCLSELTMSVLLFGAGTQTAGTLLFELQSYADPPAASVVATLVVLIALATDTLARKVKDR